MNDTSKQKEIPEIIIEPLHAAIRCFFVNHKAEGKIYLWINQNLPRRSRGRFIRKSLKLYREGKIKW